MLELLPRFELGTSSLPTDCLLSMYRFPVLWGPFCSGKPETIVLSAPLSPPRFFLLWVNLWVRRYAFVYWRKNSLSAIRSTKSYFGTLYWFFLYYPDSLGYLIFNSRVLPVASCLSPNLVDPVSNIGSYSFNILFS